jgi:1,4-dihydroxy-2-naphthoate polyprenyltransferase
MTSARDLLGPMRLPFVILAPVCVLLGIATALRATGRVDPWEVALVVIGGIAAHVSVNTFNEYHDFKSGLDARTRRTPFSGGSGVLPERPGAARLTLATALATLVVTVVIGAYFALVRGPAILPLGALGILVIVAYTPWLTRHPLLCLIAPGLGFGLMALGTHVALTG